MTQTVGILAYGSLIDDPGEEILAATIETRGPVQTPFNVEFARTSISRGGAPTLVPVGQGGASVTAYIVVVNVPEDEAANRLYRRETRKSNGVYKQPKIVSDKTVIVERLESFHGLDVVLYTKIAANIAPLNAKRLAELAIASVRNAPPGRDGISYLIAAKKNSIETPLSNEYEREILDHFRPKTLEEALVQARRDT